MRRRRKCSFFVAESYVNQQTPLLLWLDNSMLNRSSRMAIKSFLALVFIFYNCANGHGMQAKAKPDPSDAHATARWLVSQNTWGIISTISIDLQGAPFGNVISYSDGPPGQGTGIPYFYLTLLDPTPRDLEKNSLCSLTVSEFPLGTCSGIDPENPTCSKLTLTGKMEALNMSGPVADFASQALFSKHSEMMDWPTDHNFQFFKLNIENIFLIDWFGGPKPLSVAEYLKPGRLVLSS